MEDNQKTSVTKITRNHFWKNKNNEGSQKHYR